MRSESGDGRSLPVFFDPSRARWPRIRNVLLVVCGLFCLLGGALAVSVFSPSVLPALGLQFNQTLHSGPRLARRHLASTTVNKTRHKDKPSKKPSVRKSPAVAGAKTGGHTANAGSLTVGYFVNWDEASFGSLKSNLAAIDILVPEWLHIYGRRREVTKTMPNIRRTSNSLPRKPSVLRVMPLVNNCHSDGFDSVNLDPRPGRQGPARCRHRPDVNVCEGPLLRRADHRF